MLVGWEPVSLLRFLTWLCSGVESGRHLGRSGYPGRAGNAQSPDLPRWTSAFTGAGAAEGRHSGLAASGLPDQAEDAQPLHWNGGPGSGKDTATPCRPGSEPEGGQGEDTASGTTPSWAMQSLGHDSRTGIPYDPWPITQLKASIHNRYAMCCGLPPGKVSFLCLLLLTSLACPDTHTSQSLFCNPHGQLYHASSLSFPCLSAFFFFKWLAPFQYHSLLFKVTVASLHKSDSCQYVKGENKCHLIHFILFQFSKHLWSNIMYWAPEKIQT